MDKLKLSKIILIVLCALGGRLGQVRALVVGSNAAVSRQAAVTFPAADSNNTALGFASFDRGFSLQSNTTTCTFDGFFPVGGNIALNGGRLFLQQDLMFDSLSRIESVGRIDGGVNRYSVSLSGDQFGGSSIGGALSFITQASSIGKGIRTVAWSPDNQYLAVGTTSGGGNEVFVYLFNGTSLTLVTSVNISAEVRCVRWHPSGSYLAVGSGLIGNFFDLFVPEIYIYSFDGATLTSASTINVNVGIRSLSWHPSGNFLVAGRETGADELVVYSFNTGTGALAQLSTYDFSPNRSVRDNATNFSSDGQYLCVGSDNNSLAIFFFNGSTLTLTIDRNTGGGSVFGADWNPLQGDFIVIGQESNPGVVVYEYSRTSSTLTLRDSLFRDSSVIDVRWHPTGCFFVTTALASAGGGELLLYSFDPDAKTFDVIQDVETNDSLYYQDWTPNGLYLAEGGDAGVPRVWTFRNSGSMQFVDTTLSLEGTIRLGSPTTMYKNCRINGNGHALDFGASTLCGLQVGKINVYRGSQLVIEDVIIKNLQGDRISCLTNDATITFSNCVLELSGSYTFSTGALIFSGDVVVTGTSPFIFTSQVQAKISSQSTLCFEPETTFRYAPIVGNKNLLRMSGETSRLFLNGCTLSSTRTGLRLSNGTLLFDNKVTLTTSALNGAEGFEFSNSLNIRVAPDALIDVYGFLRV